MHPYVIESVAAERVRDLHAAAARYHRASVARGPRQSWVAAASAGFARSLTSAREFIRREQLGPVSGACTTC